MRQLAADPAVRGGWHERYRDRGLVVVGAHAPEFGFEHDLDNVRRATRELDVGYPVVIDNEFAVWRAFDNHYWPAVYLVDGDGRVRYTHFGEEAYEETERAVQKLLGIDEELVQVDAGGFAEAAGWDRLRSPETYVGAARGERRIDRRPARSRSTSGRSAAGGPSTPSPPSSTTAGGSIAYRFEGRDLNLVLAARSRRHFTVRLDGQAPGDDHGLDVDASGEGTVSEPRMYQLVRQRSPAQRTVEVAFRDAGVRAYVFTFG